MGVYANRMSQSIAIEYKDIQKPQIKRPGRNKSLDEVMNKFHIDRATGISAKPEKKEDQSLISQQKNENIVIYDQIFNDNLNQIQDKM